MTNTTNTTDKTHAQLVEAAYEHAEFEREEPGTCYLIARKKAEELDGAMVFNANRDTSTTYLYPSCIYAFPDSTYCEVAYTYVLTLTEQEVGEIVALNEGR